MTGVATGNCTITADQVGNASYAAALQSTQSFTVSPGSQVINVTTAAPSTAAYGSQFTVAATAAGGAVTYSSGSESVCTNNGAVFTLLSGSGTCIVQFAQAGM